jgi:hypothetical protein
MGSDISIVDKHAPDEDNQIFLLFVIFADVLHEEGLHFSDFVRNFMQGKLNTVRNQTESDTDVREAVRSQQVKGSVKCNILPASAGNLWVGCDRRLGAKPRLEELLVNGSSFNRGSLLIARNLNQSLTERSSEG